MFLKSEIFFLKYQSSIPHPCERFPYVYLVDNCPDSWNYNLPDIEDEDTILSILHQPITNNLRVHASARVRYTFGNSHSYTLLLKHLEQNYHTLLQLYRS